MGKRTKKLTNITRVVHRGGTKGWWVRIQRGNKSVSKLFSDRVYGGAKKAQTEAIKFRDQHIRKLPEPLHTGSSKPRPSAKGYYLRSRERRGKEERAWVATWSEDGRQREKSFSVQEHGYHQARRLAIEFRKKKVQQLTK